MMKTFAHLRQLLRDRRGALLATTAAALPVVAGFAGLGIEVGMWYSDKRDLQTAADAAALSGAFERVRGNAPGLQSAARYEAQRNGFENGTGSTIAVNNPPLRGSKAGETTAVEVVLTRPHPLLFTSLLVSADVTIAARSVAGVDTTGEACVLALDRTANAALNNQGSTTVKMNGCVMASNSNAPNAIQVSGSATVDAFSLWTVGGAVVDGSANLTIERPITTRAWELDDPWQDLQVPPYSGCDLTNPDFKGVATTIGPASPDGVFVICGDFKLTAHDVVTLRPGTYIINRGIFQLLGGSTLKCDCTEPQHGVTIILTSSASASQIGTFDIRAGANVNLRAPSDGTTPFRGVLLYQDRRAAVNTTGVNKLNGTATMTLSGSIYVPQQGVEFQGNNASSHTCTQIVARTVSFTGNSYIDNTACKAAGVEPVTVTQARLVE